MLFVSVYSFEIADKDSSDIQLALLNLRHKMAHQKDYNMQNFQLNKDETIGVSSENEWRCVCLYSHILV